MSSRMPIQVQVCAAITRINSNDMAIVAQSRPEITMEETIGTYEYSCIPRTDKTILLVLSDTEASSAYGDNEMLTLAIAHEITASTLNIVTCKTLATQFVYCVKQNVVMP